VRKFIDETSGGKKAVAKIVARAWRDAEYRTKLVEDPRATFAAEGIFVPNEVAITVTCDSELHLNLLLGDGPSSGYPVASLPENSDVRAVFAHIDARCREDHAFRAAFLADPTRTVRDLGCALPQGVTISVHLARPDHAFFILPQPPRAQVNVDGTRRRDREDEAPLYFSVPLPPPRSGTWDAASEAALYFPIPQQPARSGAGEAALYFSIPVQPPRSGTWDGARSR